MQPNQGDRTPFHFRHLGILGILFTLFLGILTPLAMALGALGVVDPRLLLLVAAPWILGMLIAWLGRKSPLKFWLAPLMLSLTAPALAIGYNGLVPQSWTRMQAIPSLIVTLLINIVSVGTFTVYLYQMCPRRCPECRRGTMIPLRNFCGLGTRTRNTR